jgi:hypothetical protein
MSKQKLGSLQVERDHSTDWAIVCPACNKLLEYQPRFVQEIRNPRFHCRFCDKTGVATWNQDLRSRLS